MEYIDGFMKFPNWVRNCPYLTLTEKVVFSTILSYYNNGHKSLANERIAWENGINVSSVKRAKIRLRELGLIVYTESAGRVTTRYELVQNEPVQFKPVQNELVKPVQNELVRYQPVQNEPVEDGNSGKPVQNEPVEPVQNEPLKEYNKRKNINESKDIVTKGTYNSSYSTSYSQTIRDIFEKNDNSQLDYYFTIPTEDAFKLIGKDFYLDFDLRDAGITQDIWDIARNELQAVPEMI